MSNSHEGQSVIAPGKRGISSVAVCLVVVLCLVCCALILLIPTQSTSADTVYQGF